VARPDPVEVEVEEFHSCMFFFVCGTARHGMVRPFCEFTGTIHDDLNVCGWRHYEA
jgi:hypothetical protein